eukprot:3401182-Rhodomonas_salina.4
MYSQTATFSALLQKNRFRAPPGTTHAVRPGNPRDARDDRVEVGACACRMMDVLAAKGKGRC